MSKRLPWVKFHIKQFYEATSNAKLTAEETAVYWRMLTIMWERKDNALKNDLELIARQLQPEFFGLRKLTLKRKILPKLIGLFFFVDSDGNLRQIRLEKERISARTKSEKAKKSAEERWAELRKIKDLADANALPTQCEGNAIEKEKENKKEIQKEDSAPSELPPSGDPPIDFRKELFGRGLTTLARITGKTPNSCRSLVGKWLKAVQDEAIHVLGAIEEAERNQVADPVGWVSYSLKQFQTEGRGNDGKTGYGGQQGGKQSFISFGYERLRDSIEESEREAAGPIRQKP